MSIKDLLVSDSVWRKKDLYLELPVGEEEVIQKVTTRHVTTDKGKHSRVDFLREFSPSPSPEDFELYKAQIRLSLFFHPLTRRAIKKLSLESVLALEKAVIEENKAKERLRFLLKENNLH